MTTPSEDTPEQQPDKGGVQDRINQLTRQKNDHSRRAEAAEAKVGELTQQVMRLTETVGDMTTRQSAPTTPAQDPLATLLGTSAPQAKDAPAQTSGAPDLAAMIQNAVNSAIAPMVQERQQEKETQLLAQAQLQSFEGAAQFVPDVAVEGTVAADLFQELWNSSPELQVAPNGPAFVVNAVAGILGQDARTSKVQDVKKQAATSPAPSSPLNRLASLPGQNATKESVVRDLAAKGESVGLTSNELTGLIGLKLGTASVSEE